MPEVEAAPAEKSRAGTAKGKKEDKEGVQEDEQHQQVPQLDARGNWFEERVVNALKIKNDKWKKLISTPENM